MREKNILEERCDFMMSKERRRYYIGFAIGVGLLLLGRVKSYSLTIGYDFEKQDTSGVVQNILGDGYPGVLEGKVTKVVKNKPAFGQSCLELKNVCKDNIPGYYGRVRIGKIPLKKDFTFACFVKFRNLTGTQLKNGQRMPIAYRLLSNYPNDPSPGGDPGTLTISIFNRRLYFSYQVDKTKEVYRHTTGLFNETDRWYQVAVVRQGNKIIFYVDGKVERTTGSSGELPEELFLAPEDFCLGEDPIDRSANETLDGWMDDVFIADRAWSAEDVIKHFKFGIGPVNIGSRLELFVDRFLVERMTGSARFQLHRPQRREIVFRTDKPWEGNACAYQSIFKDGDIYKMYYRGVHLAWVKSAQSLPKHPWVLCYAESDDGIHWRRPELGIFEFNGSKKNNIILTPEVVKKFKGCPAHTAVFKDANPDCPPDEKYKW